MSQSEIVRLRQHIAAEYTAAYRALHEYATVAKHEIITHRFNQAGLYTDELARFVGKEEAEEIAAEIYMQFEADETAQEDQARACSQSQGLHVEDDRITVKAQLKWEGVQFLKMVSYVELHTDGNVITFPPGSRKARLTRISRHCHTITLPDATEITIIDGDATAVLLLIDIANQETVHLCW